MLNGKYELIATTIDHEEIGSYIGYGIRYGEHTVTDISLDRAKIENLIERMNLNELSPLHMMSFPRMASVIVSKAVMCSISQPFGQHCDKSKPMTSEASFHARPMLPFSPQNR